MTTEQKIWTFLMSKLNNPYGAAAVMGSFYIESKLNPSLLQSTFAKKLGMTSEEYTKAVDVGTYTKDDFVYDHAGYGIAQWTFWSRKEALYAFADDANASVGNLEMQLNFFWKEFQSYTTALKTLKSATDIRTASDAFTTRYEKPTDTSETALKRRADKAQEYYNKYAEPVQKRKYVRITANNVNVRSGPGKTNKSYFRVGEGTKFDWCGTSADGWNAVMLWVHPAYSEVIEE